LADRPDKRWGEHARPRRHRRNLLDVQCKPQELGNVLGNLFDKHTRRQIEDALLLERWPELVGETIARNTEALRIEGGVLILRVTHPVWRSELAGLKGELILKLNTAAGRQAVRDIHFR
jgi:predicted nucleic acid-binding Zn ribbon protein